MIKNGSGCAIKSDPAYEPTLTNMSSTNLTGNEFNGLCLRAGSLSTSASWNETEVTYVILGDLIVPFGKTLNWEPGIVIKPADSNTEVIVDGRLNSNGTPGGRVYITSIADVSLGGADRSSIDKQSFYWNQVDPGL